MAKKSKYNSITFNPNTMEEIRLTDILAFGSSIQSETDTVRQTDVSILEQGLSSLADQNNLHEFTVNKYGTHEKPRTRHYEFESSIFQPTLTAVTQQIAYVYAQISETDEEDAVGLDIENWNRLTRFAAWFDDFLLSRQIRMNSNPILNAAPDGSFDIHWQTDVFELLVKLNANKADGISFYWDDFDKSFWIKGGLKDQFEHQLAMNPKYQTAIIN